MNKRLFLLVACFVFISALSIAKKPPKFKRYGELKNGECVVYACRIKHMVGAGYKFPVTISEFNHETGSFSEKKEVCKLKKNSYFPIVLEANKFYWIGIGALWNFDGTLFCGSEGSETVITQQVETVTRSTEKGESLIRIVESNQSLSDINVSSMELIVKNANSYDEIINKIKLTDSKINRFSAESNSELFDLIKDFRLSVE